MVLSTPMITILLSPLNLVTHVADASTQCSTIGIPGSLALVAGNYLRIDPYGQLHWSLPDALTGLAWALPIALLGMRLSVLPIKYHLLHLVWVC